MTSSRHQLAVYTNTAHTYTHTITVFLAAQQLAGACLAGIPLVLSLARSVTIKQPTTNTGERPNSPPTNWQLRRPTEGDGYRHSCWAGCRWMPKSNVESYLRIFSCLHKDWTWSLPHNERFALEFVEDDRQFVPRLLLASSLSYLFSLLPVSFLLHLAFALPKWLRPSTAAQILDWNSDTFEYESNMCKLISLPRCVPVIWTHTQFDEWYSSELRNKIVHTRVFPDFFSFRMEN